MEQAEKSLADKLNKASSYKECMELLTEVDKECENEEWSKKGYKKLILCRALNLATTKKQCLDVRMKAGIVGYTRLKKEAFNKALSLPE